MDKNKKKGFTLVELIVVLAILAILAAMLVPALTGYIDKANEKKLTAVTRQVVVAAQTVVSETYAKNGKFEVPIIYALVYDGKAIVPDVNDDGISFKEICELAEIIDGKLTYSESERAYVGKFKYNIKDIWITYSPEGIVTNLTLSNGKYECGYSVDLDSYVIKELSQ